MQNTLKTFLTLALLSPAAFAHGQQQVPSYSPSRPTLSPYLYLTRPQEGPFPNYQTFVQPLKNQIQTNQTQQLQIQQLQQSQQQLQQQQYGAANVAPTGIGAGYNTLSHYYPGLGAGTGTHGAQTGKRSAGKR